MKLDISNRDLNEANRKVYHIIQKVIDTKRRSSDGKRLKRRTGNLRSEIKPFFKLEDKKLVVDVEVMEYYQYLDEGTRRIYPWFLSEEIMDNEEMIELIQNLLKKGVEGAVLGMVSKINKG